MPALRWERIGPLSGPANVLNNRYRVHKPPGRRWVVEDMDTGHVVWGHIDGRPYRTMAQAKNRAEAIAASAS